MRIAFPDSNSVSMTSHVFVRLLLIVGLFWLPACNREGPFSSDPNVARHQATRLIPKGTSEARAKKILQERGFYLSRLDSDPAAANHLLVGTCTQRKHTWLVGVVIIVGRAVACSVTVTEE